MATWPHGQMATWPHGHMVTWSHGDLLTPALPALVGNNCFDCIVERTGIGRCLEVISYQETCLLLLSSSRLEGEPQSRKRHKRDRKRKSQLPSLFSIPSSRPPNSLSFCLCFYISSESGSQVPTIFVLPGRRSTHQDL